MSKKIYFDHAATTPVSSTVFNAMKPYFEEYFGNPSSLHQFGQKAMAGVVKARQQAAKFLNCNPNEVVFTSGATESDNLALAGIIKKSLVRNPHLITTAFEHPAILETAKALQKEGIKATFLKPSTEGIVNKKIVQEAIKPETSIISIMYVNNEVGTIQPIAEIGQLIKKINLERQGQNLPKIIFHTDAVQAAPFLDCDVKKLGVDLLSISGHKINGPKGVGLLYIKEGMSLAPRIFGGHQERGIRPGTYNTPGIVGLGQALTEITQNRLSHNKKTQPLRDRIIDFVLEKIPQTRLNGSREKRGPGNANLSFKNIEGESILMSLDLEGIAVSTGSACASGSLEPSHVLRAINLPQEYIHGSIRITLGPENTPQEVEKFIQVLSPIIKRLRKMSPFKD